MRLCIPAFEGRYGEPWLYKTPHHPDYKKDRFERMVRVGLATTAAPTFFEALPNNVIAARSVSVASSRALPCVKESTRWTKSSAPTFDYRIASAVKGAVAIEPVDLRDFMAFARSLDLDSAGALRSVAEFAQSLM